MKRTLSLILAALLLASSIISCGKTEPKETEASETKAVETKSSDSTPPTTEAPETAAPVPEYAYDTSLITENGVAKAHIVLSEAASADEKTAADELAYHIKLVSGGAEVAITNTAQEDSLPIIIATPDTLPELEELFPEDLAWLRTTSETTEDGRDKHWGDDGFSIRAYEGKIYIFGATALGALNGTYDFIEENLDLLWIGANEEGIIYDENPTITTVKTNYKEKSPFVIKHGGGHSELYCGRNKENTLGVYGGHHTVKSNILHSPIYDSSITEYWDTSVTGVHVSASDSEQVNFWSQLTADTVAAQVIATLDSFSDDTRPKYINVAMEDIYPPCIYPEMNEPFEYAPGQFIEPTDAAYLSTVYFTFINRVARKVAEKYPDVYVSTLAYMWATNSPKCEIDDNVIVWFCPINEDYTHENFAYTAAQQGLSDSVREAQALEAWRIEHPDTLMHIYSYYFCYYVQGWYERPLWDRMQTDFQLYADMGMLGIYSCLATYQGSDSPYRWQEASNPNQFTYNDGWDMNILSTWIYHKLLWDPYEDIDALVAKFIDKVYGDASEYMKEYYDLIQLSWEEGCEMLSYEFNVNFGFGGAEFYFTYFLDFELDDGTYFLDAVKDVLTKAYEAADDKAKEFIRHPYEVYQDWTRFIP